MKSLIILISLIFISFAGLDAYAAELKTANDPVIIYTAANPYDQVIKREIREFNQFRKLTDRYLKYRERGQRVAARQTLRRISSIIRSEVDQTRNKYRYEIRYSGEFRSSSELYRKRRSSEYSKRRPQQSYRRNSGSGIVDLYRTQLIRQNKLQSDISELIRSGYYLDVILAEKILAFEQTLRDEVKLLTGDSRRLSNRR